jgi:hypothetical protein
MMENKMLDLENILAKFQKIVSSKICNDLAKKSRFVQRSTSQLQGYEFARAMMVPNGFIEAETLNSLAVRMRGINKSCNLSASALAQRINTRGAEAFMKACFGKILKEVVKKDFVGVSDLKNLSGFNRILIEDSTKAELHEKLSPYFKGTGGTASKAAVKIDYIFDYLSEDVVYIDFFSGNIPDQSLASRIIPILEKDDLVLRDLGYYALERLKEIEQKDAYYISRLKIDVLIYESIESAEPLDLAKFLDQHIFRGIVDVQVYIGKNKHPVRLVACLMDEQAVNKKRRMANRTSNRRGRKMGKKKSNLMRFCIFITNIISVEMLSSEAIMATYRARWRVELIFKQWKSCLNLHIFKGFNKERFHCFLYGRLIMVLLLASISPPLMQYALVLGRELSYHKLTNYIIADHAFPQALYEGKMDQFVDRLVKDIPRRLCMDKRERNSLRKNIRLERSYYNELKIMGLHLNVA